MSDWEDFERNGDVTTAMSAFSRLDSNRRPYTWRFGESLNRARRKQDKTFAVPLVIPCSTIVVLWTSLGYEQCAVQLKVKTPLSETSFRVTTHYAPERRVIDFST